MEGTNRFKVPLIRGHTITDSTNLALTSTAIGKVEKNIYISVSGAKPGDILALVFDTEGEPGKINRFYWNTIIDKSTEDFYHKREFIRKSKARGYIHSCKDVSNGGILGTLFQLARYAKLGARLDLDRFEKEYLLLDMPYSPQEFMSLFLTSAFLISFPPPHTKKMRNLIAESDMAYLELGVLTGGEAIVLYDADGEHPLLE